MPGIGRVGTDKAKGVIKGPGASTVFADGKKVSLDGDEVTSHGKAPHAKATIISELASTVMADGKKPVMKGSIASCKHTVIPGSDTVFVS